MSIRVNLDMCDSKKIYLHGFLRIKDDTKNDKLCYIESPTHEIKNRNKNS